MSDPVDRRVAEIRVEVAWRRQLLEETTEALRQIIAEAFSATTKYPVSVRSDPLGTISVTYCKELLGQVVIKEVALLHVSRLIHDSCDVSFAEGIARPAAHVLDSPYGLQQAAGLVVEATIEAMAQKHRGRM